MTKISLSPSTASYGELKGKSLFGVQALSNRQTAPNYGFGSGTRGAAAKIFAGAEHAKTYNYGVESPGPLYSLSSSMGLQHEGGTPTLPRWQFGTEDRFHSRSAGGPGPGRYESDSALARQRTSGRATFPQYGFGTSDRSHTAKLFVSSLHEKSSAGKKSPGPAYLNNAFDTSCTSIHDQGSSFGFGSAERFSVSDRNLNASMSLPGPASYGEISDTTHSGVGVQLTSRRATQPAVGFGTSNRDHRAKLFMSSEHAKTSGGAYACSPGPAVYTPASSIGRQLTTRGKTTSAWGFSKAPRFQMNADDNGTPGPGAYAI